MVWPLANNVAKRKGNTAIVCANRKGRSCPYRHSQTLMKKKWIVRRLDLHLFSSTLSVGLSDPQSSIKFENRCRTKHVPDAPSPTAILKLHSCAQNLHKLAVVESAVPPGLQKPGDFDFGICSATLTLPPKPKDFEMM